MATAISANRAELLAIAKSVASEKMIDESIVIEAMEEAIQKSARNRYGAENDIRAKLDPQTGDLRLWRVVEVVEEVEDPCGQLGRRLVGRRRVLGRPHRELHGVAAGAVLLGQLHGEGEGRHAVQRSRIDADRQVEPHPQVADVVGAQAVLHLLQGLVPARSLHLLRREPAPGVGAPEVLQAQPLEIGPQRDGLR